MSTATDTSLRVSRVIEAGREKVFRAWTEERHLRRWMCPEGSTVGDAEVDLTVGGAYRIRIESPDGGVHTAVGVYREIEPPSRLVFSWDWEEEEHRMGETLVIVELADLGGSTEVTIVHERFPAAEAKKAHEEGWTSCLNQLERLFA